MILPFTISATIRHDRPDRLNRCPVCIRITIERKSTYKATGFRVDPAHWDDVKKRVSSKVPNHMLINSTISRMIQELEASLLERKMAGKDITRKTAQRVMAGKGSTDVHKYIQEFIARNKGMKKSSTIEVYDHFSRKLKRFSPVLSFADITPLFLQEYDQWERSVLGNDQNTVWKSFKCLKSIFNQAIKDEITSNYPFKDYSIKYKQKLKTYLSQDDEDKIMELAERSDIPDGLRVVALYFLLGCATGLRHSDLARIHDGGIIKNGRIVLLTKKTGEVVSIKITSRISRILEMIGSRRQLSLQKCNEYLKVIQRIAGIHTTLSTHLARHTFTMRLVEKGVSKDVAQKILGHTSIKTTDVYFRITDAIVDKAMELLEED